MGLAISDGGIDRIPQRRRYAIGKSGLTVVALALVLGSLLACQPTQQPRVEGAVQNPQVQKPRVAEKKEPTVTAVKKSGCELPELQEAAAFVMEAWAVPDGKFNIGEPLRLQMRVSAPTYMNVFHVSTSCKVTRLVHNRTMAAGEIIDFPAQEMQVTVKPPPGDEAFYFVATRADLNMFAQADILRGDEIASLDMTPKEFFVRLDHASGRINPADQSIFTLRTTVVRH